MAPMSGELRRVDIWRLICSVPVAYWYIGCDVWRRADLRHFGHLYSKMWFSMWFVCSVTGLSLFNTIWRTPPFAIELLI